MLKEHKENLLGIYIMISDIDTFWQHETHPKLMDMYPTKKQWMWAFTSQLCMEALLHSFMAEYMLNIEDMEHFYGPINDQ